MATVHIVLAQVSEGAQTPGGLLPIPNSVPTAVDTVTSSGTSALSSITTDSEVGVWSITAMGGNVWVKFGVDTPVAAMDDGWLILDGQTRDFGVSTNAEKIAVKDAA